MPKATVPKVEPRRIQVTAAAGGEGGAAPKIMKA